MKTNPFNNENPYFNAGKEPIDLTDEEYERLRKQESAFIEGGLTETEKLRAICKHIRPDGLGNTLVNNGDGSVTCTTCGFTFYTWDWGSASECMRDCNDKNTEEEQQDDDANSKLIEVMEDILETNEEMLQDESTKEIIQKRWASQRKDNSLIAKLSDNLKEKLKGLCDHLLSDGTSAFENNNDGTCSCKLCGYTHYPKLCFENILTDPVEAEKAALKNIFDHIMFLSPYSIDRTTESIEIYKNIAEFIDEVPELQEERKKKNPFLNNSIPSYNDANPNLGPANLNELIGKCTKKLEEEE